MAPGPLMPTYPEHVWRSYEARGAWAAEATIHEWARYFPGYR